MEKPFPYQLYLVISEEACLGRNFLEVAEAAVQGGVDLVQLREKNDTPQEFLNKAFELKELLDRYEVPLIINDNLEIATQCKAAGIHVGNSDMLPTTIRKSWESCTILGYSIEYLEQLYNEQTYTSDYLGISPVFSTSTKTDTVTTWGFDGVQKIRSITQKPLVAIGNMNASNARQVVEAGADCIAVVSAICAAPKPKNAAQLLRKEIQKGLKNRANLLNL